MMISLLPLRRFLKLVPRSAAHFSPALCFAKYTKISQKKLKSSTAEPEPSSPLAATPPLTPEQLDRMARNKRAAQERLTSAQAPPGFGESWRNGLSAEFGKPYFKQVRVQNELHDTALTLSHSFRTVLTSLNPSQLMTFVSEERKRCTVYPPPEHVFTWTQMGDIRDVSLFQFNLCSKT